MSASSGIIRRIPLLLVSDDVLLPGASMRISVRSSNNMNMVKSRLLSRNTLSSAVIGVIPTRPEHSESENEEVENIQSNTVGTAAVVVQVTGTNWPRPMYTLLVTGIYRFRLDRLLQSTPYKVGSVTQLDNLTLDEADIDAENKELGELIESLREKARQLLDMYDISLPVVVKLKKLLKTLPPQNLPDICASIVKASYTEKLQVLDSVDLEERLRKTLPLLVRQIEGLRLLQKSKKNRMQIVPRSKLPAVLGKMIQTPRDMLDDDKDTDNELLDLENKIREAQMPDQANKIAMNELKRLEKMSPHMPDYAMTRNYLDLLVELPWSKLTKDTLDIEQARRDLDCDHYAMDKLKKRVIEFLAVRQLKNSLKGPILCFVGPPGVGKTSIGRSIAHTLGREFHRISLGGVCDQSDIRGHRRTYIGAMPGRIIQGLKTAGTRNPVFLLDEIDKLTRGVHGDPSAALLEVLDPEQNHTFVDHYVNVPFDLSQVIFIATANSLAGIPAPLRDRVEIIPVAGYTQEEKFHIAIRHLIPKQLAAHGLTSEQLQILEDSIKCTIEKYTREAGVRQLERKIGAICRAVAVRVAEASSKHERADKDTDAVHHETDDEKDAHLAENVVDPPEMPIVIDEHALEDILGVPRFERESRDRFDEPGVAAGLAWTEVGGEVMHVEATRMEGDGKLTLTGQLGSVMRESARLALNWLRSHAEGCGIAVAQGSDLLESTDVHIHFPAGAVSKDGPSAGVTVASALVSLFTGRSVRADTAMTGEITLHGLVLPVGGIRDKILAAHRAGFMRVVIPQKNEKDLKDIPATVRSEMSIIPCARLEQVLCAVFPEGFPDLGRDVEVVTSKL
ncbi:PREDICTED: lon protease homolog 2, peroxisomal-like [Priapulus caudatus]|uniref:Lon protease homolog 2, peroxisomal n=1 Tax=Priapulus caudatus TaxID=37621 RepID=A0ABM1E8I8_PRICU|nr:PREDICTED: lon protease homolog 2, peroxisomal-like [Priapulus caudatus]XP_014668510.1 PREDICTED: lon protease homolog 2, peroxisomal-like [Priapulus caudatus]XP_014668511.1 PREDICTED: lon protease homolog 2, peroxisomal-like [Priapulus caudatus]